MAYSRAVSLRLATYGCGCEPAFSDLKLACEFLLPSLLVDWNNLPLLRLATRIHVSTILMRLDVSDRTQAVVTALQRGLVHL
jgi:hypothetical protein